MKFLAASQDKFLVKSLCQEFKVQGYEVFAAKNKMELEKICQNTDIDVIVSDYFIQGHCFFETFDLVKFAEGVLPPEVIILVENKNELTSEEAFALGAWALFQKPINLKKLFYTVEDAVFSRKEGLKRRSDDRVMLMARIEYCINKSKEIFTCFSDNISFGGFFGVTQNNIPKENEEIFFKLILTEKEYYEGKGKVAWSCTTPYIGGQLGFGVKFIGRREDYVKFLVPIVNEARTRQIETSSFEIENFITIINQSIRAAKEKISKRKTEIIFREPQEHVFVMCRFYKIMQVLTQLLYDVIYPVREIAGSSCLLTLSKLDKKILFQIQCSPGGSSFNTDTLLNETIIPLIESHGGRIESDYNSLGAEFRLELPTQ